MVLNKAKLKILQLIYIIFLIKSFSCIIVFPFKTVLVNNTYNISSNSKEYNSTHFLKDYFTKYLYTTIKIGNPPQEVNTIITYDDCNFKIGKAKRCIYSPDYLSHYNRNLSEDFNYTDFYTLHISEFLGNKGQSAEDTIFAYTDLNLQKLSKFSNIGFYLGSDTEDSLCGIIGFRMMNYATFCYQCNNIIKSFKSKDIINSYQWILNYTSEDEGLLILGGNISELISNFNFDNLYSPYSIMGGSSFPWMIKISKIECGDNNYSIGYNEVNLEINNDYSLIIGGSSYLLYIEDNFFNNYINQNICSKSLINQIDNYKYHIFECDKEKFGEKDIKNFPILSFRMKSFEKKFIFEGKDLFIATKYKYFFSIIFSYTWRESWVMGKIFLRKFPTMIDLDKKILYIYNDDNNNKDDNNKSNGGESESKTNEKNNEVNGNMNLSAKFIVLMVLIIIVIVCVFSVLFYYIGKNLNKLKKRKANELNDEYDYSLAEDNNAINKNS